MYTKMGFQELGTWIIDNEKWARRIVQREDELGIQGIKHLAEQFRGTSEREECMVRWPVVKSQAVEP